MGYGKVRDVYLPKNMDSFQSPSAKKRIHHQSLAAERYDLEQRLDELFRKMAIELSALYFEHQVRLGHAALQPYYDEIESIQQDLQTLQPSLFSPQSSMPSQQPLYPVETQNYASLQNTFPQNRTFTSSFQPQGPRTIKLKIRILEEQQEKIPSESITGTSTQQLGVVGSEELLQQLRQKKLNDQQNDATVNPVIQTQPEQAVKILPKKRF